MQGIKHIIECHCVLPQYKNQPKAVYHKFIVFSILDSSGAVIPKCARCNNCGVVHNIIDLCKSEILTGREEGAVIDIEDIELMIPSSLSNVLKNYDCDVATWENVLFILNNEKWENHVILNRKTEKNDIHGKLLKIKGPKKFNIEPFTIRNTI